MKLLKQKKAMVMIFFLSILIVIIIMPMLFFTLYTKQAQFEKTLGSLQLDLIQTYHSAEQDLLYIDQSAKYSAIQTSYDLAANGGFYFPSSCGKFSDTEYQLWNNKDKECYPNYELSFKTRLTNNLNDYFNVNKLPPPKYEFTILAQNIIGIAAENMIYKLENGNYSIKPSFNINIGYNINEYQNIITQAKQLVEKCSTADLQNCIKQNLPAGFLFGSCEGDQTIKDRTTRFCIISPTKLPILNPTTNKIESTNIKYKFALYFPEQPQQQ
ncbi:hypothetical protein KY331_02040 [Candidatus Woesearchaeota archaeon]|nr:hypothetical protein [Candidatus Woesearchaeota archaeon]